METRTVKFVSFWFTDEDGVRRTARRGATVELNEEDLERGERLGAFAAEGDAAGPEEGSLEEVVLADLSDVELLEWLQDEPVPSVPKIIEATKGDAEVAERLIAAENAATGNDPRTSLIAGLKKIIERGNE